MLNDVILHGVTTRGEQVIAANAKGAALISGLGFDQFKFHTYSHGKEKPGQNQPGSLKLREGYGIWSVDPVVKL
jgi:hypothetical protein